ncbi:MAG: hypothetical protein WCP58_03240 [bacterium]
MRSPQAINKSEGEGSSDRSLALNMDMDGIERELTIDGSAIGVARAVTAGCSSDAG